MKFEPFVEKVPTGALVIIPGNYVLIDESHNVRSEESVFMGCGDTTPTTETNTETWELIEAVDFAS